MSHHDELEIKRDVLRKSVARLKDVLNFGNISCYLHEIKLSTTEIEKLKRVDNNEGNSVAIEQLLLDSFRRRIRCWDEFLSILRRCDYQDEASHLEQEYQRRIHRRQGHSRHHEPPSGIVAHAGTPPVHMPHDGQTGDVPNFPATPTSTPPWIEDQEGKITNLTVANDTSKKTGPTRHVQVSETQDYNNPSNRHVYENDAGVENIDANLVKLSPNSKQMPVQSVGESASNTNLELDLVKETSSELCSSELSTASNLNWCSDSYDTTQRVANVQQMADECLQEDASSTEVLQASDGAQSPTVERGEKSLSNQVVYQITGDGITNFGRFDQQQGEQQGQPHQPGHQQLQGEQQQQLEQHQMELLYSQQRLQEGEQQALHPQIQQDQHGYQQDEQLDHQEQLQQQMQQFEGHVSADAVGQIPCVVHGFQTPSVRSFVLEYSDKEVKGDNYTGNDQPDGNAGSYPVDGAGDTFQPSNVGMDTPNTVSNVGMDTPDTVSPAVVDSEYTASPGLKPEGRWLPVRNETTIVVQNYLSHGVEGTVNLIKSGINIPVNHSEPSVSEQEHNEVTDGQSSVMDEAAEPHRRSVSFDSDVYNVEDINHGFKLLNIIAGLLAVGAVIAMHWK